jgi:hypothetical protein
MGCAGPPDGAEALAVGVLGLTAGAPLAAMEIQHRLDVMAERLAANGWRLSTPERVRVATLNLAMGLFAALQEAGWLHPYVAVWSWTVEEVGAS